MFKETIAYFLIRVINGVLGLAAVFVLTRLMSAEQYGTYALGLASITLGASILFQWISVAIARFYAAHTDEPEKLIAEGNRLFLRTSVLALLILFICVLWQYDSVDKAARFFIIGIGVIVIALHNFRLQIANARRQPISYGALTVTRAAFALCATVLFVKLGHGGIGAISGFVIGALLSTTVLRRKYITKTYHNNEEIRRRMVSYGLPLTLTYISTMVLDVSDRFMIGWLFGTPAVAGYAAAYDLTQQIVGAIMNILLLASYPNITTAWEKGGATAAKKAMSPLSSAMLLGAPLLAGIFIGGAEEISKISFGEVIRTDAAKIIPWISFAIAVGCFKSYFLDISFQLAKATRVQLYITAAMAIINVIFNFILMPVYGVVGAAASTAIAFTAGAILSWWFGRGLDVYPSKKLDALKMLLVLAATVLAMYSTPTNTELSWGAAVARLLSGLAAYTFSSLVLNLASIRTSIIDRIRKL